MARAARRAPPPAGWASDPPSPFARSGPRERQRAATRERIAVGGLLPMALLAGGYATDADDEATELDVVTPAA